MKIAISGAGIAGPTLAYWLRRCGHEPTLIESAPVFRTGGYIIDFWGVGYDIAERMGLVPELQETGYRVREARFVDANGRRKGGFSAEVFARMTGGRYVSLPRGDLAAAIYRTVEDKVETLFGDEIEALEDLGDGVRVTLAQGDSRDFDLVVGADGLHSRVRDLVFGPQETFERDLGYRVAAFEVAGYRPRDELVYISHNEPGRMVARFSLRGDTTLFLFVFTAGRMPARAADNAGARKDIVQEVFADARWEVPDILEAMADVDDIYFDRVSQIRMERWSKGRTVLIGDAGACVSLLAGEGTGLAMTSAYVLAGELARAGGDHEVAFARHEERLRDFIEGKQKSAVSLAASFTPKTAAGIWMRNQATKLLRVSALRDRLVGGSLRDDVELPDYDM